jgi:putative transposase
MPPAWHQRADAVPLEVEKFGGMSVSDAKRLRQLESENAKLKKLVAELTLDKEALRELLSKDL